MDASLRGADPLGFRLSDILGMLMVYNKHADRISYGGHYANLVMLFGLKLHLEKSSKGSE